MALSSQEAATVEDTNRLDTILRYVAALALVLAAALIPMLIG